MWPNDIEHDEWNGSPMGNYSLLIATFDRFIAAHKIATEMGDVAHPINGHNTNTATDTTNLLLVLRAFDE